MKASISSWKASQGFQINHYDLRISRRNLDCICQTLIQSNFRKLQCRCGFAKPFFLHCGAQ